MMKKLDNMFLLSRSVLRAVISRSFGIHHPVTASWNITSKCNLNCRHCGVYLNSPTELNTAQAFELADFLRNKGISWIFISGGEPLLRKDLGLIINRFRGLGIRVGVSSNGTLISSRSELIKNADKLIMSLDGPREVHDEIRGKGAYDSLMKSLPVVAEMGLDLHFTSVILKNNIEHIDFILDKARDTGATLSIQPGRVNRLDSSEYNPLSVSEEEHKKVIEYLIEKKKGGYPNLFNSVQGLRHMLNWPNPRRIPCVAGRLHFYISPGGYMRGCLNFPQVSYEQNKDSVSSCFEEEYAKIRQYNCPECWCGESIEYNLAYGISPSSVIHLLRENIR